LFKARQVPATHQIFVILRYVLAIQMLHHRFRLEAVHRVVPIGQGGC